MRFDQTSLVLLSTVFSALNASPSAAQTSYAVGGFAGAVASRQVRARAPDSSERNDVLAGAYVDVQTPLAWLSVIAEAALVRRGGEYDTGQVSGRIPVQSARADYLAMTLMPTVGAGVGPLRAYAGIALSVESGIGSAVPAELSALLAEQTTQVFAVGGAGGVALDFANRWRGAVEVRRQVQLTPAFRSDQGDTRHQSTELVFRFGVRPGR